MGRNFLTLCDRVIRFDGFPNIGLDFCDRRTEAMSPAPP